MISAEVLSLADKIHLAVQNCNEPGQSEEAEKSLLYLSRRMTAELESPFEVVRRIAFQVCLTKLARSLLSYNRIPSEDLLPLARPE